jgi:hypothetical protein
MSNQTSINVAELASAGNLKINLDTPPESKMTGSVAWLQAQSISACFSSGCERTELDDRLVHVAILRVGKYAYVIASDGAIPDAGRPTEWMSADGIHEIPFGDSYIRDPESEAYIRLSPAADSLLQNAVLAIREEFVAWISRVDRAQGIKITLVRTMK